MSTVAHQSASIGTARRSLGRTALRSASGSRPERHASAIAAVRLRSAGPSITCAFLVVDTRVDPLDPPRTGRAPPARPRSRQRCSRGSAPRCGRLASAASSESQSVSVRPERPSRSIRNTHPALPGSPATNGATCAPTCSAQVLEGLGQAGPGRRSCMHRDHAPFDGEQLICPSSQGSPARGTSPVRETWELSDVSRESAGTRRAGNGRPRARHGQRGEQKPSLSMGPPGRLMIPDFIGRPVGAGLDSPHEGVEDEDDGEPRGSRRGVVELAAGRSRAGGAWVS